MPVKSPIEAMDAALAAIGTPASPGVTDDELPPEGDEEIEENPPTGDDDETPPGDGEGDPPGDDDPAGEGDGDPDETDEEKAEREAAEAAAAETPEQKAEREAAEAASAEPPDHVNDPIPEGLTKKTSERMQFLANRVRDLEPEAETGRELIQHINNSNMTADEFSMALTFGRLKHSDNVEDHRKAYAILWSGLKELAPLIGETLPGVDLLEGHPDLAKQVQDGKLDAKIAAEVAAGRNRRKADTAAATRAQQNNQSANTRAQQNAQLETQVKGELNELGKNLAKNDKQFEAKMALLTKADRAAIQNTPPGLRVAAFLKKYVALKITAKPAAGKPGGKPGQQPLRAGKTPASGGSGVRREPKSPVEAMDFALGLK